MSINKDGLRQVMRSWPNGVTVVTAKHGGNQYGMIVSPFTSTELELFRYSSHWKDPA